MATLLFGVLIVVLGVLFLFDNLGWYAFSFGDFVVDFWPVALIIIGAALIYKQFRSKSDPAWTDYVSKDFPKTVGDKKLKPTRIPPEGLNIKLGVGEIALDLSETVLNNGENNIECGLGAGELRIIVPRNVALKASGRAGVGDVYLLGQHVDGFAARLNHEDDGYAAAARKINLTTKVGMGEIRVSHP
ncbi:MAG: hypothetical protein KAT58_09240 [candidate division Zixibacteria bacterium]|nr:hypothetical protein [candidate division Zixibacteria bacterium]